MGCAAVCCIALSGEQGIVKRSERRADDFIDDAEQHPEWMGVSGV